MRMSFGMEQKIFIDNLDTALIRCPDCGIKKILQMSGRPLTEPITRFKYKCTCGHIQRAFIEKRNHRAKDLHLAGTFLSRGTTKCSGKMTIRRLNSKGIALKTNLEQNISPGVAMIVEFVLDDPKQSIVKKEVTVLARNGHYLSAEFISQEHYDNLGPYLFFNKLYV